MYVDYNKMPIKLYGTIVIPLSSNRWKIEFTSLLISENRARNLVGSNMHAELWIATTQTKRIEIDSLTVEAVLDPISKYWRNHSTKRYALVFNRLGSSRNNKVFTNFKVHLIARQVKCRKVPIHIQDQVANEIKNLVNDKPIEKLEKGSPFLFIAPMVLTAKKDGSIKLVFWMPKSGWTNTSCPICMKSLILLFTSLLKTFREKCGSHF